MTTILVTGATGRVGRHVVQGLLDAGVSVRALVRTPLLAGLPNEVEVVQGDIYDPAAVERAASEVDAAFLLWPSYSAEGAGDVVAALTKQVPRVVYLSSLNVADEDPAASGVWGEIETMLSDADWTFLRPGGFMVNTQEWADEIRTGDVVRMPSPGAGRSLIHERDIAAVAVLALLDDKHIGQTYRLTGPEVLTQAEQVAVLGEAVGKSARVEEQSAEAVRQAMVEQGVDPSFADGALAYWASLVDTPEPVTDTVESLLGRPALTFREWAEEHADEFRVLPTAEVANRYVEAFRTGDLSRATSLIAPDMVRVAPLEGTGDHQGLADIMANAQQLTADVEILGVDLLGPLLLDDHFAVRFTFDARDRTTGDRDASTKLSLYTVTTGRITREEVFYLTPPPGA
ncbi:NAD(P)H-binding protein [Kribbella sp. CA-294648]|uniref:NAD(P)H-binding protein n=1 Tax=Kribbella sp. CA-294648 TaxID=3239948 RepID=UPI003D8E2B7C